MSEQAWHEWRRHGIGGSDIPAILGLTTWSSPWRVWGEKLGLLEPSEATPRQRVGQVLEDAIAQLFHDETGLYVYGQQGWEQHPEEPWARCTVDGYVTETAHYAQGAEPLGVFEAKTDGSFGWPDGVPPRIEAQVRWQMWVTDQPRAWVAVLHSGFRFHVHELGRDADEEAFIVDRARRFWTEHVLTGEPPEADGSDATARAIAAVWPQHHEGRTAELDPWLIDQRESLKTVIRDASAELAETENAIKATLADAEIGTVDGEPAVTYRTSERRGYTVKPATVRTLRSVTRSSSQ